MTRFRRNNEIREEKIDRTNLKMVKLNLRSPVPGNTISTNNQKPLNINSIKEN
jgi:hypothetical protein